MPLSPSPPVYVVEPMPPLIPEEDRLALLELDTPTIGHVLDAGFMDAGIRSPYPGAKMAGTAVTVRVTVPDSVMGHYALKFVRPGDILVIDRGQDQRTACWGNATAHAAKAAGLTGLIIDGATSDLAESNGIGLPVWSRGLSPVTTKYRGLGGEMNLPIQCGGAAVRPGDAILADDNGVVVIAASRLREVIEASRVWMRMEAEFLQTLREQPKLCYPDHTGASAIVEAAIAARAAHR